MCDHKKKEANVPKQTSQATHTVHTLYTHTQTHTCVQRKAQHTSPKRVGGAYLKRPQDFRVAKTKVAIDRCRMLTPYALCVCVCGVSVTFPPPPPHSPLSCPGNLLFMQCLRVDGKYMQITRP